MLLDGRYSINLGITFRSLSLPIWLRNVTTYFMASDLRTGNSFTMDISYFTTFVKTLKHTNVQLLPFDLARSETIWLSKNSCKFTSSLACVVPCFDVAPFCAIDVTRYMAASLLFQFKVWSFAYNCNGSTYL